MMLIVELLGGLGNQMFQYAFGLSVSTQLRIPVKFDVQNLLDRTPRANFTSRDFGLDVFNAEVAIATTSDMALYKELPAAGFTRLSQRIQRRILKASTFVEQQQFAYDPQVLNVGRNTRFIGYWQSARYFEPCAAIIQKAFTFKHSLTGLNQSLAADIAAAPSVSMHVRRGDYVSNAQANAVHGTCTPAYYRAAVEMLQAKVGAIVLFVFSDEPDWVRKNLCFDVTTVYVSHNSGNASFEDLRLMSLCRHNIIANSSFSWWGAWLNQNPNKIVISPRKWMNNIDGAADLIPVSWIQL